MPRIPLPLAETTIPVPSGIRPEGFGAAFTGTQAIGQSLMRLGESFGELAAAKHDLNVKTEVHAAKAALEMDLALFDADLQLTERDPDAYSRKWEEGRTRLQRAASERLTRPERRQGFEAVATDVLARQQPAALKHRNTLFIEQQEGRVTAILDTKRTLMGLTPLDDLEGFAAHYRDARETVLAMRPLWGDKRVNEELIKVRQTALRERGRRQREEDPEAFLKEADTTYIGMDPETRDRYVEVAHGRIEARQREQIRLQEKQDKKDAAEAEKERKRQVDDLDEQADAGTLTAEGLRTAKDNRIAIDEDYRRLAEKIRRGAAAGGRTDDIVYNRLELDLLENPQSHSDAEIRRIQAEGKLAATGPRSAASLLKLRSDEVTAKDISQQPLFKQGLHELRESLRGGVGPLESLTREQATRLENAEREYHDIARSGKVGLDGLPELARKIVDRVRTQTPLQMGDPGPKRLLRYQSHQDLLAAKQAGLIPDAEFNRQFDLMRRLGLLPAGQEKPRGGR